MKNMKSLYKMNKTELYKNATEQKLINVEFDDITIKELINVLSGQNKNNAPENEGKQAENDKINDIEEETNIENDKKEENEQIEDNNEDQKDNNKEISTLDYYKNKHKEKVSKETKLTKKQIEQYYKNKR